MKRKELGWMGTVIDHHLHHSAAVIASFPLFVFYSRRSRADDSQKKTFILFNCLQSTRLG